MKKKTNAVVSGAIPVGVAVTNPKESQAAEKPKKSKATKPVIEKPESAETNLPPKPEVDYIEEALQLVESVEMKEHLRGWLTSGKVKHPVDTCAEIVFNAPVPVEQKLSTLKQFLKCDGDLAETKLFIRDIEIALFECGNDIVGAEYNLCLCNPPDSYDKKTVKFKSFGEAVNFIKSLEEDTETNAATSEVGDVDAWWLGDAFQNSLDMVVRRIKSARKQTDSSVAQGTDEAILFSLSKEIKLKEWIDKEPVLKPWITWYLSEEGLIVYFKFDHKIVYRYSDVIPGVLNFTVPYQPGDIVSTDCTPFSKEKKVLILQNEDAFGSIDAGGVTCLYVNNAGLLSAGCFKTNDFLDEPEESHVSSLYRSRTYDGELSEDEIPLGYLSKLLKEDPKLGREIYHFVLRFIDTISEASYRRRSALEAGDVEEVEEEGRSADWYLDLKYDGVYLGQLKKEFELK